MQRHFHWVVLLCFAVFAAPSPAFSMDFLCKALPLIGKTARKVASLFAVEGEIDLNREPLLDPEGAAWLNRFGLKKTLEDFYQATKPKPVTTPDRVVCNGTSYTVRTILGDGGDGTVSTINYAGEVQVAKVIRNVHLAKFYYNNYLHYKNMGVPSPRVIDKDFSRGTFILQWVRGIPVSELFLSLSPRQADIVAEKWKDFTKRFKDQLPAIPRNFVLNLDDGQFYMIDPH